MQFPLTLNLRYCTSNIKPLSRHDDTISLVTCDRKKKNPRDHELPRSLTPLATTHIPAKHQKTSSSFLQPARVTIKNKIGWLPSPTPTQRESRVPVTPVWKRSWKSSTPVGIPTTSPASEKTATASIFARSCAVLKTRYILVENSWWTLQ